MIYKSVLIIKLLKGVKINFYKNTLAWNRFGRKCQCFDCKFLEIWDQLKITRGLKCNY